MTKCPHHVCAGLVLVQPGGFVLDQLLAPVADGRPAAARLLGRVHQTFAVCGPGAGGVKNLARLHPSDFPIIQQVSYKVLTLKEAEKRDRLKLKERHVCGFAPGKTLLSALQSWLCEMPTLTYYIFIYIVHISMTHCTSFYST